MTKEELLQHKNVQKLLAINLTLETIDPSLHNFYFEVLVLRREIASTIDDPKPRYVKRLNKDLHDFFLRNRKIIEKIEE